jgi:biopolymer transport protein ExbD
MPVVTPGRRPAFPPIGRLRTSPLSGGKKSGFVSLNLTAMVDMFTILVIFLIQLFKTTGEVELNDRIKIPHSQAGEPLEEPGTVVQLDKDGYMLLDNQEIPSDQMGSELDVEIPGMVDRLTKMREFRESIEGRNPNEPYQGVLIVQADIKTDFRSVRRIIASANSAGWAKLKFVTMPDKVKKDGEEGGEG